MPKLTIRSVESAKAGRHADGGGLYLFVKPSGSRSWILRIVLHGRRRDFGLGSVSLKPPTPEMEAIPLGQRRVLSLAEARVKADEARRWVRAGRDPTIEWSKGRQVVPTFEAAARVYHDKAQPGWRNGKHGDQWLSTLEAHAFPILGSLPVDQIEAVDVERVLLPIWLVIPETARRVRQRVLAVLDAAHANKHRSSEAPRNAVRELMKKIRQPGKSNFAAMPWQEAPDFVARLRAKDSTIGRLALEFLCHTVARSGEVRGATWGEVDLATKEWRLPASRMKAGKPHIVPLTEPASRILAHMRRLWRGKPEELIFPGNNGKALSDATLNKAMRSVEGSGTVHGLRSTFRDWSAEAGFADAWAEAALAHGNPDATEAAYKRTTFFPHRRDTLMPAWSAYLAGKDNVVALVTDRRA